MMKLSTTQEYYVLTVAALGKKTKVKKNERGICLTVSCLYEMISNKIVSLDEKDRLVIQAELPAEYYYLNSLYENIKKSKPKTIKKIVLSYMTAMTSQKVSVLSDNIAGDLEGKKILKKIPDSGIMNQEKYIVEESLVSDIVYDLKKAIDNPNSSVVKQLLLLVLLKEGKIIKYYFNKKEIEVIKSMIKGVDERNYSKEVKNLVNTVNSTIATSIAAISAASTVSS